MTHPIQFRATIAGRPRRITFSDAARAQAWLDAQPEGAYAVTVERWRVRRSRDQNGYYWGVVVAMIAEHCGYEPDEAHFALRWQFLRVPDRTPPTARSTASLSTAEFEDYLSRVRTWSSAELGVWIPGPNESVTIGVA